MAPTALAEQRQEEIRRMAQLLQLDAQLMALRRGKLLEMGAALERPAVEFIPLGLDAQDINIILHQPSARIRRERRRCNSV